MKTAVSIPDDIFEQAEALAHRAKRSRSEVYARALSDYIALHAPDRVTQAMDEALDRINEGMDALASRAALRTLERTEW